MAKFTKERRQEIILEFTRQNNGWFDPAAFVAHVAKVGPDHPAHAWFTWDDARAAEAHRLDQARDFARGLVVEFHVEEVRSDPVRVVERSLPFLTSPMASRGSGGGYFLTDPQDAEHMDELARQAAQSLRWFVRRYGAVVQHMGGAIDPLEELAERLEGGEASAAA